MRPDPPPRLPIGPVPPQATAGLHVALSGGLDSSVLLHALASDPALGCGVRAVHVHHGLHAAADGWAAACMRACDLLGVPLRVVHVEVATDAGKGLEAAARAERMRVFGEVLASGGVVALAHHQRDQAETFLLRALRASGVDGLAAMQPLRNHAAGVLWRPLLALPRAALLAYAVAHGLHWVDDPSNQRDAADRNYLRLHVLPLLRGRWPDTDAGLARSASLAAEAIGLLEAEDERLLQSASVSRDALSIASLQATPPARVARVLRRWVAGCGLPPLPGAGVRRILTDLLGVQASPGTATFAWAGAAVSRWAGMLHAYRVQPALPEEYSRHWDGRDPLPLPGGGQLSLAPSQESGVAWGEDAPGPFMVVARRGGERIRLPGRAHHHALKHVLQTAGVPPWLRRCMPLLLAADGRLLAVGDRILAHGFEDWLQRHGLALAWQPPAGSCDPAHGSRGDGNASDAAGPVP